ncbi:MAG: carboxylating nicotinate-nucleotide diphosphorylase [Pirellulaceae bacterium]|nr:carboxylating nicotinate-nucleotide diphosphorylase [Pirellulaceae bacterium]
MSQPQRDFPQQAIDDHLLDDLAQLILLAMREDLSRGFDMTTVAVVPEGLPATAAVVARMPGMGAGLDLVDSILETMNCSITAEMLVRDGQPFTAGQQLAVLRGDARDVLTCERTVLNFLGRLCGIATWTHRHVQLISDLPARLYDTRKTTPGWRRLEKYAVRCGGGHNHRGGLYDAILIKDNHLACHWRATGQALGPAQAVHHARQFLKSQPGAPPDMIVEVEVDSLQQLADALMADPDIVLLDNMSPPQLAEAVAMRNRTNPAVQLEASGGVRLETLREIAETGVDRISAGALTHSAFNLDLGLDWLVD